MITKHSNASICLVFDVDLLTKNPFSDNFSMVFGMVDFPITHFSGFDGFVGQNPTAFHRYPPPVRRSVPPQPRSGHRHDPSGPPADFDVTFPPLGQVFVGGFLGFCLVLFCCFEKGF